MARKRWTAEEILERLAEVVDDVGRGVRLREFLDCGGVPESQIRRAFGTWELLRRRAGLMPADRDRRRVSDAELWEEFSRLFKVLRRTPTGRELDRFGRYSARTYYVRFGKRRNLRRAYYKWLQQRLAAAQQSAARSGGAAEQKAGNALRDAECPHQHPESCKDAGCFTGRHAWGWASSRTP